MISIKIQCGCGQRYSFDVEPVNGAMPWPVACPVCGADGTVVANEVIAESLAAAPAQLALDTSKGSAASIPAPTGALRLRTAKPTGNKIPGVSE